MPRRQAGGLFAGAKRNLLEPLLKRQRRAAAIARFLHKQISLLATILSRCRVRILNLCWEPASLGAVSFRSRKLLNWRRRGLGPGVGFGGPVAAAQYRLRVG